MLEMILVYRRQLKNHSKKRAQKKHWGKIYLKESSPNPLTREQWRGINQLQCEC